MTNRRPRILVVGYGVVGKRVADALALQEDMDMAGVVDLQPTRLVEVAEERDYPLYAASEQAATEFQTRGIGCRGTLSDALTSCDLVIDTSPKGVAKGNIDLYQSASLPFIVNGGERKDAAGVSFSALANYQEAVGANSVRVVSCNTTALCRILVAMKSLGTLGEIFVVAVRRAADPVKTSRGPINAIIPVLGGLSHHGQDAQEVLPDLRIRSMAVSVSTTLSHVHLLHLQFSKVTSRDEIVAALHRTPRVRLVRGSDGISSTAHVMELAKDLLRPRGDMWEVVVWEDSVYVDSTNAYLSYSVHMESIVVPENVDAARAMFQLHSTGGASVRATDQALGCYQAEADYHFR